MATEENLESNWKLHHIGIPVRNLDKSMEDFASLGVAEFQPEFQIDSGKAAEYLVYGKTPEPAVKTRGVMGRMGPLGVELLQPVEGENSPQGAVGANRRVGKHDHRDDRRPRHAVPEA